MSNPFESLGTPTTPDFEEVSLELEFETPAPAAAPTPANDDVSPNPLAAFRYDQNKVKEEAEKTFSVKILPEGNYTGTVKKFYLHTYQTKTNTTRKLYQLDFVVDGDPYIYRRQYYIDTPKAAEIVNMMYVDLQRLAPNELNLQKFGKETGAQELIGKRFELKATVDGEGDSQRNNFRIVRLVS